MPHLFSYSQRGLIPSPRLKLCSHLINCPIHFARSLLIVEPDGMPYQADEADDSLEGFLSVIEILDFSLHLLPPP